MKLKPRNKITKGCSGAQKAAPAEPWRYAEMPQGRMLMTTGANSAYTLSGSHTQGLGTLYGYLQSLEFLLRLFLYKRRSRPHTFFKRGQNLTGLDIGAILPENAITDYDPLSKLIRRYNAIAERSFPGYEIDPKLVTLRDALAHGRVFIPKNGLPPQLLKFASPKNGKVKVMYSASLTPHWCKTEILRVHDDINKVGAAIQKANASRRRPV